MLHSLSEDIQLCYRKAEENARRAGDAHIGAVRADYLSVERRWLRLALSYECQQRLKLFVSENSRHGKGAGRGIALANDVGLPTGKTSAKVPEVDKTSKKTEASSHSADHDHRRRLVHARRPERFDRIIRTQSGDVCVGRRLSCVGRAGEHRVFDLGRSSPWNGRL